MAKNIVSMTDQQARNGLKHLKILAVCQGIAAVLILLNLFGLLPDLSEIASKSNDTEIKVLFGLIFYQITTAMLLFASIFSSLQRRWNMLGRISGLFCIGVLTPLGGLLTTYSFWVLTRPSVKALFIAEEQKNFEAS